MNNREWLYSLDVADLADWFDAEHVETEERALDGDTDALERKSADLIHEYYKPMIAELRTERMAERAYWHNQMHAILDMLNGKERFWGACMEYPLDELTIPPSEVAQSLFQKRIDECDEMRKQVDELKELNEYHALQYELASEDADRLQVQVDKLTAERDKLQEQLLIGWECECRLQAERERYREKFGKCLDYADAIHDLMDEGMA